ncbi:hypothetical protein K6M90_17000 [Rhizobium sp. 9T]|uniref:Uncharacterized protein n=1 Tax=Rhizobium croatiense TaxID=2867516 RepID=A0ABS7LTF3_9HYPH|nr:MULTISPECIES: hypothetical protein [Rhizobium]MBY4609347.1 hypothetical protein [Rhizobium croatiense]MBY4628134.1 hypothetical protein [Rhizobium croatiense]PDV87122.1 hypothetical protein CO652_17660 [Rhizobium sp. H4]
MTDRSRRSASIPVCSSALSLLERQIALRQIIDELQDLCDGAANRRPVLHHLVQTIRESTVSIARAVDDCCDDRQLFQLRATIVRVETDAAITCH